MDVFPKDFIGRHFPLWDAFESIIHFLLKSSDFRINSFLWFHDLIDEKIFDSVIPYKFFHCKAGKNAIRDPGKVNIIPYLYWPPCVVIHLDSRHFSLRVRYVQNSGMTGTISLLAFRRNRDLFDRPLIWCGSFSFFLFWRNRAHQESPALREIGSFSSGVSSLANSAYFPDNVSSFCRIDCFVSVNSRCRYVPGR